MSQCLCLTKDGVGPRCSKVAKSGQVFCAQHIKKCTHKSGQAVQVPQKKQALEAALKKQKQEAELLKHQAIEAALKKQALEAALKQQALEAALKKQQQEAELKKKYEAQQAELQKQMIAKLAAEKKVTKKTVEKKPAAKKPAAKKEARGCVRQIDKKYVSRPSPAFPANECCGHVKKGNSGGLFISIADVNNVCRWYPYKPEKHGVVPVDKED